MFRKELSGARCFILPLLPALALLLFFASAAYAPVMDVNASGLDFTVGTADWELFYDYSWGAIVSGIYDLNRDGAAKTNLTVANRGIDAWSLYNTSISNYENSYGQQPGLKLGLNEDLNSRVTIRVDNAFSWGTKMDLNFTKIHTIYPIIGGLRIISHMEITDTNALDDGENFSVSIHRTFANESTADILGYGDNNSVEPPTDTEWWRANQRYDMPETADGNSMIVTGYVKSAEPSFYDNIWDVDNEYYYRHDYSGWYDNDLAPMVYGQMEYLNTIILLSDTKTLGGGINLVGLVVDENQIDYRMLDWRNPDDLYMKTGTFSEFDFNTGAYLLTASANQVDFNISTNGIQNDQGNWDTNRYSPAFEISSYTAAARPLMKVNGNVLTEGVDYVADVNALGQYAVVVWLGDLTVKDSNAQITIGLDVNAPAVTITSPSAGSETAANSMNVKYWGYDTNAIKKYYVQMDALGWIDNGTNITKNFLGLAAGEHTAYVIAQDYADNNSSTASVTFTLTAPAATIRHIDVNATGDDFEVGTVDYNLFFNQSAGGTITNVYDLNRDSATKTNLAITIDSTGFDVWFFRFVDNANTYGREYYDASARLRATEDLNSRVKIESSAGYLAAANKPRNDLNFVKTSSIYPIIGGLRLVTHLEITDTNAEKATTNMDYVIHYNYGKDSGMLAISDNNTLEPQGGSEWWHAIQRTDLNSDFDSNSMIVTGYAKPTADSNFFRVKWVPNSVYDYATNGTSGWSESTFDPEFTSGETAYVNYVTFYSGAAQLGGGITLNGLTIDENEMDYRMLDYRNPDDLYMSAGTFSEFDFNTGAYLLTASGNDVDFNISTNGVMNDQNTWDTNRYSPAFQISDYTVSLRPRMKVNGTELTEGIDFVADVNAEGQYAVVVWLGSLTGEDENAQLQIGDDFISDSTPPTTSWDGNTSWTKYDQNITLTCTDDSSGCASTAYRIDTNGASVVSYGAWQTYTAAGIQVTDDGNYAIDFNSTDTAGNVGDTNTFYVLIDSNSPAVAITSPAAASTTAASGMNVVYSGNDSNGSGILRYWVKIDSDAYINNGATASKYFPNLAAGEHTAYVIATDLADNNSAEDSVTFTLTSPSAIIQHIDVNATGNDFEVGTSDWNLFFDQSEGGMIGGVYDLKSMPAGENLVATTGTSAFFDQWAAYEPAPLGIYAWESEDYTARLWKMEDLNSRVQIVTENALCRFDSSTKYSYDINVFHQTSIYPIGLSETGRGIVRIVSHVEFTDTNADNPTTNIDHLSNMIGTSTYQTDWNSYSDNNVSAPAGSEWWFATQNTKGTVDVNVVFARGFSGDGSPGFYNQMWNPTVAAGWMPPPSLGSFCAVGDGCWNDADLNPEFNYGQMEYINYVSFMADTDWLTYIEYPVLKELHDENRIDYVMLDYRNPDDLFMTTGTFSEFDFNTGAYLLTASANEVDFNISTNGIYNDHNTWDTNRYRPAFQISNYTAETRPLMRVNGEDQNEGIDFVADVNTEGQYAVVVWFGDLTGDDQNAQIQIDNDWAAGANTAPDVNVTSPSDANYLSQYYSGTDKNVSVVFSVSDPDNDELNADLYYSSVAGSFTTAIINDLNLNNHANLAYLTCADTNWQDATTCVYDWNIALVPDGNYYLDLNVYDTADANSADSGDYAFHVDNNAPAVSITSPAAASETASNSMNIKYWGIDTNSGLKKYWVQMDSLGWIDNGTNITKNFLGLAAGSHTAYVIATDNADNNSSTATVTFTLTTPAATIRHLDVNATGANFEVGTSDFNLFFKQANGGCIYKFTDLNIDSTNALFNPISQADGNVLDQWAFVKDSGWRQERWADARLSLDENMASRVKIISEGQPSNNTDVNFAKTNTIYPNKKIYIHMVFTDTNAAAESTNYANVYHMIDTGQPVGWAAYTDNNDSTPDTDDWWWQVLRTDLNSDFDSNTTINKGYYGAGTFYKGKWNPNGTGGFNPTSNTTYWQDTDLSPEFTYGETSFISYLIILSNTGESGAKGQEGWLDAVYLDYRTPDNLFMTTGTSQGFDYNVGAYKLTASGNRVDFNISTKVGATDVNRYSPAFEISGYTSATRPLMRLNGVDLNEGIDYVADVNTAADYAVVVWLGSLTAHDQNAQLQMAASWNTVPVVTISSPADGSSVAGNSLFVQYTGSSDDGISKYYVKIDSNAWIDNGTSTSYTFRDLNYYQHTFSVRATDIYDRNSADVNATVTITIRNTQDGTISRADTTPKKEVKVPVEEVPVEVILQQTAIVYEQTAREVRNVMQEYGIPQEQVSQAVAMAGQVSLIRSIEVTRKAERDSAVITISVHNKSSKPMEDVTVIERIPKDVAENAEEVASTYSFVVIEEDPVLRFFVGTVLPGETKDVKYTIHKKVSEDTFFSMGAPIAAASAFVGMVGKAYTLLSSYYRYIPDMKEITVTLDNAGIDPAKAEEVQELSEGLGIYKGATVIADEKGGQVTYRTNFVVKIVNSTENTLRGVTIIENVPAGVAESANILEIEGKHRVLVRSPPMLEFELGDLKAGESASVHYSVGRKVENIEMENLPSPIVLADVEEAGTGARSDAGLIIAIAAVAIILIAGILYFLRGKYSLDFKGH